MSEDNTLGRPARDLAARRAGLLLILTAVATLVAVVGRIAADADQETFAESLASIADSRVLYGAGGAGRFLSGAALALGGWLLMQTWIIRERLGTPLVPALFIVSGVLTGVSGLAAVALASGAPAGGAESPGSILETIAFARWAAGAAGFAAAGLALLVGAAFQWRAGSALRLIAPASAVLGGVMQLIWIDAATGLHRISGVGFFVWLAIIGVMLSTGRVEQIFRRNTGKR